VTPAVRNGLLAPAGLLVGPAFLLASTQAGQMLPYLACSSAWASPAFVAFPGAALSVAAGWVSWRAARPEVAPFGERSVYPNAFAFVGRLGALAALIFAYALTLQGLSSMLLTGCER
jgi:hypothetical protein